jgi:hypothetical protein
MSKRRDSAVIGAFVVGRLSEALVALSRAIAQGVRQLERQASADR